MTDPDGERRERLRARLLGTATAVPTSRVARFVKGGRSALGLGAAVLGVRRFDRETVRAFAALVDAVRVDRAPAIDDALRGLGANVLTGPARDATRALLRGFFAPLLEPGVRPIPADAGLAAKDVLRDKRLLARIGLPGKLLFLFRLRYGLYAVLHRLGARADWSGMETAWAAEARLRAA